jgi:CRP-like cAMP-binding protein
MELNELRAKAVEAFLKGRFAKAAKLYTDYCKADPHNLQARLRMGDAWEKSGNRERAIEAYRSAAEEFARDGFLPRAIAASKLVLELDPDHEAMQRLLADLYGRRDKEPEALPRHKPSEELASAAPEAVGYPAPEHVGYLTRFNEVALPDPDADPEEGTSTQGLTAAPSTPAAAGADSVGAKPAIADRGRALPPASESEKVAPPREPADDGFTELEVDLLLELPAELQMGKSGAAPSSLLQAVESTAASSLYAATKAGRPRDGQTPKPLDPVVTRVREKLPKIPLFSDLDPAPFRELIERCRLRTLKTGDRVFQQGSAGDSFFVICGGAVRILRDEPERPQELAVLHEGSFFGEMAILSDAPRAATVESTSDDTLLLEISASLLNDLSARYPQMALALKRFCRQRLLANVMSTSALFRPFTKQERKKLIELFRAREVPKGTVILKAGEVSDGLYVVLSGEVEAQSGGGLLARLREGELFGEMSLLTRSPAVANVTAVRRTSLLRLPREDFNTVMMTHPQVLELVAELADKRQRQAEELKAAETIAIDEETMLV